MFCTQCGTQANEGDKFCGNCGNAMVPSDEAPTPRPNPVPEPPSSPRDPIESVARARARAQAQAGARIDAATPASKSYGRKALKWGIRIVAFIVMMILYLVWKEAATKAGTESGAMGVVRAVVLFGGFLWIVQATGNLDGGRGGHKSAIENQSESERQRKLLELSKQAKGHGALK